MTCLLSPGIKVFVEMEVADSEEEGGESKEGQGGQLKDQCC